MQATSKGSDQTARMRRPIWGFASHTYHIVGNLMSQLKYEVHLTWNSHLWPPTYVGPSKPLLYWNGWKGHSAKNVLKWLLWNQTHRQEIFLNYFSLLRIKNKTKNNNIYLSLHFQVYKRNILSSTLTENLGLCSIIKYFKILFSHSWAFPTQNEKQNKNNNINLSIKFSGLQVEHFNPESATYKLQQTTISNFAAFTKNNK